MLRMVVLGWLAVVVLCDLAALVLVPAARLYCGIILGCIAIALVLDWTSGVKS